MCGAQNLTEFVPAWLLGQEADLRRSFVIQRLDHQPDELELMDLTRFMHGGPGRLLSCPQCGVLCREERDDADYQRDVYDPALMKHLYSRYLQAFREKTKYKSFLGDGAEIIEVGSHLGAFLQTAESWGWRPKGIDVGMETGNFARRRGLSVERIALEDYSPRNQAAAVFIWNCFEQLEPREALRQSQPAAPEARNPGAQSSECKPLPAGAGWT